MASPKLNKHELKTRETRERLLQAAQEIFVRDGYEQAELGEIAKLAGRTKGAIYAQFKSKEDIFLALIERQAIRRRAVTSERLEASDSIEGNRAAFRQTFLDFARDETWGILQLEFRLYAIRHPDAGDRLQKVYQTIIQADEEAVYAKILGPMAKGKGAIRRATAVHAGFAMLSGLHVEAKFNHAAIDRDSVERIANKVFDALLDIAPPKT